jgi:hypothetical protein
MLVLKTISPEASPGPVKDLHGKASSWRASIATMSGLA